MPSSAPRLVVRDASGNEREVEITRTPFTLGRKDDRDLVFRGDMCVSRLHAQIIQDENGYVIEDVGSKLGTFVNGERVTAGPLKGGERISLGRPDSYQLTFFVGRVVLPKLLEEFGKASESSVPQLQHLNLLLQMAQMMNRAPALEEVLTMLVDSAIRLTDAERGLLFLLDDSKELKLRLARGRGGTFLSTRLTDYSQAVILRVKHTGREEVTIEEEMTGRAAHETAIVSTGMRGIVAVPLQKHPVMELGGDTMIRAAPELLGLLYLDSRTRTASLTGLDRQVLQTFAVEGATIIENARLFRLTREQERIQHELSHEMSLARNIQQGLLPRQLPQSDFFEMHAISVPCRTVGGDYYDVLRLPGERLGLTVADVSGKGFPAAMLAATLQGAFAAVAAGDPPLEELFPRVNEFLCERTSPEMFATIFYGVLDGSGKFVWVNAGQVSPLILRPNGSVERLDSSNFPLGFFPGVTFKTQSTQLDPGAHVLVFSDGVTEAQNADAELFGEARLEEFLEGKTGLSARDLCSAVVAAVQDYVGAAPQADDLTLTVLQFGAT